VAAGFGLAAEALTEFAPFASLSRRKLSGFALHSSPARSAIAAGFGLAAEALTELLRNSWLWLWLPDCYVDEDRLIWDASALFGCGEIPEFNPEE